MMKCPQCAASVPVGSAFCPQCGFQMAMAPERSRPGETGPSPGVAGAAAAVDGTSRRAARDVPEEELWRGGYSPKAMIGSWAGGGVLTIAAIIGVAMFKPDQIGWMTLGIGALILWTALLLTFLVRKIGVSYRLTSQRLFHERGILRRVTDRVEVIDIDDVRFEQGIVERMLGVGSVLVTSSDRSTPQLLLAGIDNAKAVADVIDKARRAERERRSLYIESI